MHRTIDKYGNVVLWGALPSNRGAKYHVPPEVVDAPVFRDDPSWTLTPRCRPGRMRIAPAPRNPRRHFDKDPISRLLGEN